MVGACAYMLLHFRDQRVDNRQMRACNIGWSTYNFSVDIISGRYGMKIEDAIEFIVSAKGKFLDSPEKYEALQMGKEALEKQMPKEPISPLTFGSIGICPICSASQFNKRNYCYNCGQALKWPD
jgi:hypothetical protein